MYQQNKNVSEKCPLKQICVLKKSETKELWSRQSNLPLALLAKVNSLFKTLFWLLRVFIASTLGFEE